MAGREIWITDIREVSVCDGGFKAILFSGEKAIVLRGSLHTLMVGQARAHLALEKLSSAEVVRFPGAHQAAT